MYKILIVDDEKFIRKSIRNRIQWEKFDIEVAGEAANGREALELIAQIEPQLVLVDIRMPVMDGIAFIQEAKKRYPQVHYIIMSAYSDFEYAKKAIQLGVEDYILKPVKQEELGKILEAVTTTLREKGLARHLLEPEPETDTHELLPKETVACISFYLESQENMAVLLKETLEQTIAIAGKGEMAIYYLDEFSAGDCYVYLLNGTQITEEDCRFFTEGAWKLLGDREGVAAYAGILDRTQIRKAVRESTRLLMRKMFCPERKILSTRQRAQKERAQKRMEQIREEFDYLYQKDLLNQDCTRLCQVLEHIVKLTVNRENSIGNIESVITELLVILKKLIGKKDSEADYAILFHGLQGNKYLLRYHTEEELRQRLLSAVDNSMCSLEEKEDTDTISAIKSYIRQNYQLDLNAAEMARRFYLNASYLSTLFKEKTGMTMGTYIEGVRMEKAGEFIKETQWPVTEVAVRCGYSDPNYFTKVFKKYTGMTPRQYRERKEA